MFLDASELEKPVSSIITIAENDFSNDLIIVDLNDEHKIKVFLDKDSYEAYWNLRSKQELKKYIAGIVVMPALNEAVDKIVETSECEVPEIMVTRELDALMQDMEYRLMYQGASLEAYAEYIGKTVEEIRNERKDDAVKSVKIRLALQAILKNEKIDVTDKDILRRLFTCKNASIKIIYYRKSEEDKTNLGKLIKNMVRLIGQDELIRRTSEFNKNIEFIPQTLKNPKI